MDKFEIKKPYRIPEEEDYIAGALTVEEEMSQRGGLWLAYHNESILEVERKPSTRQFFEAIGALARLVEPIEDKNFKAVDSLYRATHAFRAGIWVAGHISHQVHNGRLRYEEVHNQLNKSLPNVIFSEQKEYEENGQYLIETGYKGLEVIGEETRLKLDDWAEEVVSDPSVRHYYTLGAGAILATSHYIYSVAYPSMELDYQVSQLLNPDEIDQFLLNNPDTSSN